jgi:hypothetical protein
MDVCKRVEHPGDCSGTDAREVDVELAEGDFNGVEVQAAGRHNLTIPSAVRGSGGSHVDRA